MTTEDGVIHIPRFGACVFRGDLLHAGSAYTTRNVRMHLYYGVRGSFYGARGVSAPRTDGQLDVVMRPDEA